MSYAIRQTYINHRTGERWTRASKKRWKTERGANKAARSIAYSWVCMPDGKTRVEESKAEVIVMNDFERQREYDNGAKDGFMNSFLGNRQLGTIGFNADYKIGWLVGICRANAYAEGYRAAENNSLICPYPKGTDIREHWVNGYRFALESKEFLNHE